MTVLVAEAPADGMLTIIEQLQEQLEQLRAQVAELQREPRAPEAPQLLWEVNEAAQITKLSAGWLGKRAAAREIPCTYMGRYLRFSREDLEELIAMHRVDPATRRPRRSRAA